MTVFVYVNPSKQAGDPEHIKVFATNAGETWFEENDPEDGMDPIIRYFETSAITDNKPVEPTIRRFNARRVGAVAES
jgi:hypothetical protein